MKRYAIPYKGLSIGNHHFEFEVDDRFFDAFEGSEIHRGHASVSVELVKTERLLTLDFTIDGEVEVTCDRCLDEFMMPVHYAGTLQVRFSETEKESDGEVMWLSPNETELPLGQYIYESISLSRPTGRFTRRMPKATACAIPKCSRVFGLSVKRSSSSSCSKPQPRPQRKMPRRKTATRLGANWKR